MRIFKKFPKDSICQVCMTNDNKECVFVPIQGTNEDGGPTYQADIFHLDCIGLMYNKEMKIIYQKLK